MLMKLRPAIFLISVIRLRISSSSAVNWISPLLSAFPVEVCGLLFVELPEDISIKNKQLHLKV